MKLYHPTMHATEILRDGFGEDSGTYLTETDHSGVWLFDRPVDNKVGGGEAAVLLELEIPEEVTSPFEWVVGMPYRQFLMPAAILNRYGPPRVLATDASNAPGHDWRLRSPALRPLARSGGNPIASD